MKKITCEICGSNDVIKKEGFFECQTCGTKYSVEEVKKIVLEGSVDISGSTVKVDNSGNIENYLNIARSAYVATNLSECEVFCNKILEIDSKYYEAWLLKGKLAICKSKIEEATNYFSNALDNTPENKVDEIKSEIVEVVNKILSIILWNCEDFLTPPSNHNSKNFLDYPSVDDANLIIENAKFMKENSKELLLRCGVKELNSMLSKAIFNFAIGKWNDEITNEYYQIQQHPAWDEWQKFFKRGDAVVYLIEKSINLFDDNSSVPAIIYKSLITIYETILFEDDKYLSEDKIGNLVSRESDYIRKNKIMEWHKKWNEIDPTHIIPTNE